MKKPDVLNKDCLPIVAVLACLPIIFLYPLLISHGWYMSDDTLRYPVLVQAFKESFLQGNWYPRWLPTLNGNYGYPTFVFYQPGFFFFVLPFALVFTNVFYALYSALYVLIVLSGWGAYRLARHFNDVKSSIVFTVLYFSGFYVWMNFCMRGDLSELFAMLLCSWPLYFMLTLSSAIEAKQSYAGSLAGLTCCLAMVMVGHPIVAVFLLGFLVAFAFTLGHSMHQGGFFLFLVGIHIVLALLISSSYWIPALQMKGQVNCKHMFDGWFATFNHLYSFSECITLAMPQCFFALAGFLTVRNKPHFQLCMALYVIGIFMMTHSSLFIWKNVAPLDFIQFPWRIWSVLTVIQYLLIIQMGNVRLHISKNDFNACLVFMLIMTGICAYSYPALQVETADKLKKELKKNDPFLTLTQKDEFAPKTFTRDGLSPVDKKTPGAEWKLSHDNAGLSPAGSGNTIQYEVDIPDKASLNPHILQIHQAYFPGWKVMVNNSDITLGAHGNTALLETNNNGLMEIRFLSPGRYNVRAWYDGPPYWFWRNAIALALAACIGIWDYSRYKAYNIRNGRTE